MSITQNTSLIWLLLIPTTIFSILGLFLFYKILKKFDNNMSVVSEAIEILTQQLNNLSKQVDLIKKNVRIVNNEVKENRTFIRKAKDKRVI